MSTSTPTLSHGAHKNKILSLSQVPKLNTKLLPTLLVIIWLKSLLKELGVQPLDPPTLWCDNIRATYLIANLVYHACTKHIELDLHFVREQVSQWLLAVWFISSKIKLFIRSLRPYQLLDFAQLETFNVHELLLRLRGRNGSNIDAQNSKIKQLASDKQTLL